VDENTLMMTAEERDALGRSALDWCLHCFDTGREPRIYASSVVHMSIPKAAGMLGLGHASVQVIPVNASLEMDVAALDGQLEADAAAGRLPVCVVGTAGDVNTGGIDPLESVAST
jgi:glutamate/tyrosine decarboxylase-like PLP-dependent enzyme